MFIRFTGKNNKRNIERNTYKMMQYKKTGLTYQEVANIFNVSRQCIYFLLNKNRS